MRRGWSRWGRFVAMVLALLALASASDAEAQRRRARRGRAEPAPEATEPEPSEETPPPAEGALPPPPPPTAPTEVAPTPPSSPPTPTPPPTTAADPGPLPPDLAPLRQEYVQLMDEMVQARSRVAIVGQELFHARMNIVVHDRTGDEQTLTRFVLELDGTPIHRTDGEIEGGDRGRQLFEGALAPGPHVLTIDMEQRAREDAEYRTAQRESFRFIVVRDRLTEITIELEDDSPIAREFRSSGEGRFEIRTRVRVVTRELPRS